MTHDDDLDRLTRTLLDPGAPSHTERAAAWDDIVQRLAPKPKRSRLRLAVPAAAGLAVAITAVIALQPSGSSPGGQLLPTASAAQIFQAAADAAGLGLPGPGEQLVSRERRVIPLDAGREEVTTTESRVAADGSGSSTTTDRVTGERETVETQRFVAGTGLVGDPFEDWRGTFTARQLRSLPTAGGPLLTVLRDAVARRVGDDKTVGLLGRDLGVVATIHYLLGRAPITAEQRGALLQLLGDAPKWTVPGTAVTPIAVRNLGPTRTTDGADAYRLQLQTQLTEAEREDASVGGLRWAIEFVVVPSEGRISELREFEDGPDAPPQVTTLAPQRIQPVAQPTTREDTP